MVLRTHKPRDRPFVSLDFGLRYSSHVALITGKEGKQDKEDCVYD